MLPDDRDEAIAQHLSTCSRCKSTLIDEVPQEDSFVRQLRYHAGSSAPAAPDRTPPDTTPSKPELSGSLPTSLGSLVRFVERDLAEEVSAERASARAETNGTTDSATASASLEMFGKFEVLTELGRGGQCRVHKARDRKLGWIVALKRLLPGSTPAARKRFLEEARAIASLKHPNIVEIRELGEVDDEPYHVLEYLEGGSLADELARREKAGQPFHAVEAARLVECLARAVACAHGQGILHRDLKPGNVLLTADGTPKVADFGLARQVDGEQTLTTGPVLFGTVPYMSPEQAAGNRQPSFSMDVHALGVILYRLLAGRVPFQGADRNETLQLIQNHPPEPPSKYRPGLDRDLEAICLECLEKKPSRRYRSAAALADDLAAWQGDDPVSVRPRGFLGGAARRARRHPVVTALILCALLGAVLLGGALWYYDPERPIREIERELARGNAVTLIGEKGSPRWSRLWLSDNETKTFPDPDDGTFTLDSSDLAMLELVRDPQMTRYRLRAQVRLNRDGRPGKVGLFVRHRELPAEDGPAQSAVHLWYNDLRNESALPAGVPEHIRLPDLGNAIDLFVYLYQRRGGNHRDFPIHADGVAPGRFKVNPQRVEKTWRDLVVDVTPEEVRCTWDGIASGPVRPARYADFLEEHLRDCKVHKAAGLNRTPEDCLPVRGGVGLVVLRVAASFRSVKIEPLPADPGKPEKE
jgi:serine/threonine-protein kinase